MDERQESLQVLPNPLTTPCWSYGLSHVKHTHTHRVIYQWPTVFSLQVSKERWLRSVFITKLSHVECIFQPPTFLLRNRNTPRWVWRSLQGNSPFTGSASFSAFCRA
jgi:hypothetical protein